MKQISNIAVLGDSILKGVVFNTDTGRYETLGNAYVDEIQRHFGVTVYNNSVFGLTAKKAYARKLHLRGLTTPDGNICDIMLIGLGGNDSDYDWTAISKTPADIHKPNQSPEDYYDTMCKMAEEIIEAGSTPVLMTLTPIIAQKYFNWFSKDCSKEGIMDWLKNIQHIYMWQEYYSNLVRDVADKYRLILVDVRSRFLVLQNLNDYVCEDGIHVNAAGHALMADCFIEALENYIKN